MLTENLGDVFEQTRNKQTFELEITNIKLKIRHVTPTDLQKLRCTILIKVV